MAKQPRHVGQLPLVAAITKHLDSLGHRNVETRHLNAVIQAADLIVAEFARPSRRAVPGMGLAAWMGSDDTGASSLAMAGHLESHLDHHSYILTGHYNRTEHPHDPADLGRCLGLLAAVPELRPHLPQMRSLTPTWAAFVERWDELERLYLEESPFGTAPRCYALIQEIEKQGVASA